jgi:group II intron reverse transcriptase/maturase
VHRPALKLPLADALRRVLANQGCAGVDGETCAAWKQNAAHWLPLLERQLDRQAYQALPLRLAWISRPLPGGPAKRRPLLIAAVRDRIVQTAWAIQLSPGWNALASPSSFGYRPGRGTQDAWRTLDQALRDGYRHVVDADIVRFFDSIPHPGLLASIPTWIPQGQPEARPYLKTWLTASTVWDGEMLRPLSRGIPQGSPLSPSIANRYLHSLDQELTDPDWCYIRYADDFVILTRSEGAAAVARNRAAAALERLGLRLHPEKTRLWPPGSSFRFLGATVRTAAGRESVVPSPPEVREDRLSFLAPYLPANRPAVNHAAPFDPSTGSTEMTTNTGSPRFTWEDVWRWLVN